MATIRFYGEFKDEIGDAWRINIHDVDYNGTAYEIKLGAEGFELSYSGDNEDRYQPIIGSSVQFTVMNEGGEFETFLNTVLPVISKISKEVVPLNPSKSKFNTFCAGFG